MIDKGWIIQMYDGGKRAKIQTSEGEILDKVLMLYSYGEASNIESNDTSLCQLIYPLGSKTNVFAVPYDTTLQPVLEATEKAVGNFKKGNKITFKANGDVELIALGDSALLGITATLLNTSGNINATGYQVATVQVVGAQGAAIADATGGVTVDAEARVAINALLARVRAHGLIIT